MIAGEGAARPFGADDVDAGDAAPARAVVGDAVHEPAHGLLPRGQERDRRVAGVHADGAFVDVAIRRREDAANAPVRGADLPCRAALVAGPLHLDYSCHE